MNTFLPWSFSWMLYQPNERILPWIQTKDHLVLHTSCCFLQLYNELLYNGTNGWNKRTVIISAEVMTLTRLTLDGFLQDPLLFQLPYQESDPVGGSGGSTCHSHPHPPTKNNNYWNPLEQKTVNFSTSN